MYKIWYSFNTPRALKFRTIIFKNLRIHKGYKNVHKKKNFKAVFELNK